MYIEMEEYAKINSVPIMMKDGIDYLCNYIKEHKIKSILEIGTAIGYSAIVMASLDEDIMVTSIERDVERYKIAVDNVKKYGLENRINLIFGDASLVEVTGEYDLIFIDASKGHNIEFFNKYKVYLKHNGVIITDNLSFHGLVEDETLIKSKNQRGIVRKIKNFIDFLDTNQEFITEYISVGDRISISKRKDN